MWCGQVLEPGAEEKIRERESQVREAALKLVREDPEAVDRIERSQALMGLLEERPELEQDVFELAEDLRAAED